MLNNILSRVVQYARRQLQQQCCCDDDGQTGIGLHEASQLLPQTYMRSFFFIHTNCNTLFFCKYTKKYLIRNDIDNL